MNNEQVELAFRWAEALESGKYKQGNKYLCHEDNFCCLGVLCETLNTPYKTKASGVRIYDGAYIDLPLSVSNLVGLDKYDHRIAFINMNDLRKMSFTEIAAVVREAAAHKSWDFVIDYSNREVLDVD